MDRSSQGPIQQTKTRPIHFFQRMKWGLIIAGIYLLVSIPCAAAYLVDRHEYSIPMFVVYYASFPVDYILFQVFRPVILPLERLPYGEAVGLCILLALTALLYLAIGQGLGRIFRAIAGRS